MSSRISRLDLGIIPSHAGEVLDVGVNSLPVAPTAAGSSLLGHLRYKLLSDERLARCLQAGESDALTTLFERHSPLLFAIARRVLRNDAEAEDAVQQIFIDVFRSIEQFDPGKGEFKTWLLMFAYHRSFDRRRHLSATGFFSTDPLEESFIDSLSESLRSTAYPSIEAGILIREVLGQIELRQRRTIELVYYEGLTAEEVASRTGETVRVVRHNLYRGLEKLRKALFKDRSAETPAPRSKGGQR
ncbi:RNA polymerase sigma factor [Granulicella sp. S156]|jgi:RNA polymerase sigma-70 factor, ECF subfamily|uniref:RNA polymerase sigma factor n=1 Tax=Granulicella sp. S156 TaxID=1747224 RepID=UPI00131A97BC|nr:sigma-70 family RNA polymerase sigma factor [Granulicella sp. S156]